MKNRILLLILILSGLCTTAYGQKAALKTNLLHGASATPNAALEFALGERTTIDIYGGFNGFDWSGNKKWKHWIVQPEFRWWLCESFNGGFLGLHLHGGEFNVGGVGPFKALKNNRYEGYFYGAGVSYGHQWILSNRWGFELELGVGYARMEYDKFCPQECGPKMESGHYNYFGPTKIQASFLFFLW